MNAAYLCALSAAAFLQLAGSAQADPVAEFFKGKVVNILIPAGPGGRTHDYATLASQHLGRFIPGNPRVIVQSMPGAGGIRVTLYSYNVAPKDGTAILFPPDNIAFSQLMTPSEAKYDATRFSWLGAISQKRGVLVIRGDRGVRTTDDMRKVELFMASSGSGSQTEVYPMLANSLLGTKMKIVRGFEGSGTTIIAIESGEMHGTVNTWQYWRRRPDWFKSGFLLAMLQFGLGREPELPDVPNIIELVESEDGKQLVRFVTSFGPIGRGLTLPPGVPPDRANALKRAFQEMLKDETFLAQANKVDLPIDALTGSQVDQVVAGVVRTPPDVVARARSTLYSK